MTAEEKAWSDETHRLARERILWREAKQREMDEAARTAQQK
jgi:hypothetical protein